MLSAGPLFITVNIINNIITFINIIIILIVIVITSIIIHAKIDAHACVLQSQLDVYYD